MVTETKQANDIKYIRLEDLLPNPYQPEGRIEVDEETAKAFGLSILEHGLMQTPVARLTPDVTQGQRYEMGDGWLRSSGFRWLVTNGHPEYAEMPVIVREFTDQQMADLVMEANTVRKDLNPIELAELYKRYLEDFGLTQAELAKRHSCSQGEIANTIRLLDLPEDIRKKIISREISETHGRQLLRLNKHPELQKKLSDRTVKEGLSVSTLSNEVQNNLYNKSKSLNPDDPSWSDPPKFDVAGCRDCDRTEKLGSPYSSGEKKLRCLDGECWKQKQDAAIAEIMEKKKAEANEAMEAARQQGVETFYQSNQLKYDQYNYLRDDFLEQYPECRTCERRASIEQHFSYKDEVDYQIVCVDVECFKKKENERHREQETRRKEEQAAREQRVLAVVSAAGIDIVARILAEDIIHEDCMPVEEVCTVLGIPEAPDDAEEDLDDDWFEDGVCEKLAAMPADDILRVVLRLRLMQYGWRMGADEILDKLEGKTPFKVEKVPIPDGIRRCEDVPCEECAGCDLATEDHTIGGAFPSGKHSLRKVCIKDYRANVEGKAPEPVHPVMQQAQREDAERQAAETGTTDDPLAGLIIHTATNGHGDHVFHLGDIKAAAKTLKTCTVSLCTQKSWGTSEAEMLDMLKNMPASSNRDLLIGFLEGKG